jgi:hypothetical protein
MTTFYSLHGTFQIGDWGRFFLGNVLVTGQEFRFCGVREVAGLHEKQHLVQGRKEYLSIFAIEFNEILGLALIKIDIHLI